MAAAALRQLGRTKAIGRFATEELLYNAVFQGMEADDGQAAGASTSRAEQAAGKRQSRDEGVEFPIHTEPERQENLGGGVSMGSSPGTPHSLLGDSG